MDESRKETRKNTTLRRLQPQTQSFSEFGRFDRTLYVPERNRSETFTESSIPQETPIVERVRHFRRTKWGFKNRGDSLRVSTSSLTNCEIESKERRGSGFSTMSFTSDDCFQESDIKRHNIIIFGIPGVGKSFLLQQMRTSEFLRSCPEGPDPNYISVPVVLGGKESILNFVEADMYIQNHGDNNQYDAFLMVYSVTDKRSFNFIANKLKKIKREIGDTKPVYIVANKVDIIRFREVSSSEGLKLAQENNCNFVEVSVSLQWNIDKVLVDITKQLQRGKKNSNCRKPSCLCIDKNMILKTSTSEEKSRKKSQVSILSRLRKLFKRKHLEL
ncbi:ras-like protein 2 [Saccostrea echinata]|uniref:ras-like protein 2 n=1 Tax=Saccostrea echinata TaxID=191078 RepID=UPI002A80210C|nr:ras-like protein 2 [Saccostrea echinata]